jgi:hypothetical protein
MLRRSCPKEERLLELASVAAEMPCTDRLRLKWHLSGCASCRARVDELKSAFESYFAPEPDIASSLLRVYGRLQADQTLVLRGWKLNETRSRADWRLVLLQRGWLFRGGLAAAGLMVAWGVWKVPGAGTLPKAVAPLPQQPPDSVGPPPWAQLRIENGNSVRVHYVRPELVHFSEFETVSSR